MTAIVFFFLIGTDGCVPCTDLFFLKRLLDLLQIGQQTDISADLDADGGKEPVKAGVGSAVDKDPRPRH